MSRSNILRRYTNEGREGGREGSHIRIKKEVFVSEERMEHSEDPHQLCWTKLHPTTQLQRQSVSDSHQCVLGLWLHTHCLQQVLNQVWQDVGHGWIDLQVTERYLQREEQSPQPPPQLPPSLTLTHIPCTGLHYLL